MNDLDGQRPDVVQEKVQDPPAATPAADPNRRSAAGSNSLFRLSGAAKPRVHRARLVEDKDGEQYAADLFAETKGLTRDRALCDAAARCRTLICLITRRVLNHGAFNKDGQVKPSLTTLQGLIETESKLLRQLSTRDQDPAPPPERVTLGDLWQDAPGAPEKPVRGGRGGAHQPPGEAALDAPVDAEVADE